MKNLNLNGLPLVLKIIICVGALIILIPVISMIFGILTGIIRLIVIIAEFCLGILLIGGIGYVIFKAVKK